MREVGVAVFCEGGKSGSWRKGEKDSIKGLPAKIHGLRSLAAVV